MNFVFGLGNPGQEYGNTRHNVGFVMLDELRRVLNFPEFQKQTKFSAEISKNGQLILAKPITFMNDSGRAAQAVVQYFTSEPQFKELRANQELPMVFVVHDDLDLELGQYKIQFGKGPHIHNGVLSVDAHLQTSLYWHVRIGVDNRHGARMQTGSEYVLQKFSPEEQTLLSPTLSAIVMELVHRL